MLKGYAPIQANEVLIEKLSGLPSLFHPSEDEEDEGLEKDELYWWDRY